MKAYFFSGFGVCAVLLTLGFISLYAQSSAQNSKVRQLQSFTPAPLDSGFAALDPTPPAGISPAQIISRFAAKETEFKQALDDYTYQRTVKLDTLDDDGKVDGEYLQVDDIVFTPAGGKYEKVVYAPDNTLTRVAMSPADFDDIEHRLPFTLTTADIGLYDISYVGKEAVDRVPTYVFDVSPKQMEKGRRYFAGRIWVDAQDFQIVVTNGKNVPDDTKRGQEDLSVPFTTYRQQIDGRYWFPVYTRAEGVLHFDNCKQCLAEDVHLREIVKYGQYKRFGSKVHIVYGGLDVAKDASQSAPAAGRPGAAGRPTEPQTSRSAAAARAAPAPQAATKE